MANSCDKYTVLMDDWLIGAISTAGETEMKRHIQSCPACREAFHECARLQTELAAFGDVLARHAPKQSVAPAVISAIAGIRARESREIRRPSRHRHWLPWLMAPLAAAATVLVFWTAGYRLGLPPSAKYAASPDAHTGARETVPPNDASQPLLKTKEMEEVKSRIFNAFFPPGPRSSELTRATFDEIAELTFEDVLAARRDAVTDPESKAAIAQWATLTVERARQLIEGDATTKGELGAAMMLPPAEVQRILLAAVEQKPQDPYLRYRLATSYGKKPETIAKAAAQYAELAAVDSDNALVHYQLAAAYFAQGDTAAALAALENARNMQQVDPYTSESAAYREQALLAAGASADVARALAAFSAGNEEYGDLTNLGNQLIDYGRYFEQTGDLEIAQQIYEAVRTFGAQISENTAYSSEQLAGLDIERAAVEVLSTLMSFIDSPENVQALAEETQHIIESFASLGEFFENINNFFSQTSDNRILQLATDFLYENGDLGLFEFLQSQNGPAANR